MPNNMDFKQLWQQQTLAASDINNVLKRAQSYRNKQQRLLWLVNTLLLLTTAFILWVWWFFEPQWISTKLGISLCVLAMAIFLIQSNRHFPWQKKVNLTANAQDYLTQLQAFENYQLWLQKNAMKLYFLLLSAGILLYLAEYTARMSLFAAILCYGISGGWLAFNWFYLRPKQIQKMAAKRNALISALKKLNSQFSAEA